MGQKKAKNHHVSFGKSRLARAAHPFSATKEVPSMGSRARYAPAWPWSLRRRTCRWRARRTAAASCGCRGAARKTRGRWRRARWVGCPPAMRPPPTSGKTVFKTIAETHVTREGLSAFHATCICTHLDRASVWEARFVGLHQAARGLGAVENSHPRPLLRLAHHHVEHLRPSSPSAVWPR